MSKIQICIGKQIRRQRSTSDTLRLVGSPVKKSKKCGGKRSVASLKESVQLGGVSQGTEPPKKSVLLRTAIRVRQHWMTGHLAPRTMCPQRSMGLGQKVYKLKARHQATFYSPTEARVMLAPSSQKPEERDFVVDSGVSMHMLRKKDISSLRKSRNLTTVITTNGEVQTSEEAQVYVHGLELFVRCNFSMTRLSLGKLCEEHGYTYEWASGEKPHLTPNGKIILCFCCCPVIVIKFERKFAFHIVTAGLTEYLSKSSIRAK